MASSPSSDQTASRVLIHTVAKLHYESELSQVDIAKRLGLSTATISRLLQRARTEGIVRIEVRDLVSPDALGEELVRTLKLKQAAVVEVPPGPSPGALAAPVGQMLLGAGLRAGSVVAIGWGRAVRAVVETGLPAIPGVLTVPATGGMQQHAPHFQINEFARLAAESMGGVPHFLHAPYLPSAGAREAFLADPAIAGSVSLWERTGAAVLGIGLPHSTNSPDETAATPNERALRDAVGDVLRHYVRRDGSVTDWEGEGRMIALSADQLRRTPLVIGVAVGEAKAAAILGAARSGLVSALATDPRTAEAVLAEAAKG